MVPHLTLVEEVLNQNSTQSMLAPAGWKGKGVLMVRGFCSSDPSSVQPDHRAGYFLLQRLNRSRFEYG